MIAATTTVIMNIRTDLIAVLRTNPNTNHNMNSNTSSSSTKKTLVDVAGHQPRRVDAAQARDSLREELRLLEAPSKECSSMNILTQVEGVRLWVAPLLDGRSCLSFLFYGFRETPRP